MLLSPRWLSVLKFIAERQYADLLSIWCAICPSNSQYIPQFEMCLSWCLGFLILPELPAVYLLLCRLINVLGMLI